MNEPRLALPPQMETTVAAIARVQRADGCIPYEHGGPADPWDHVEAAMALDVGGHHLAAHEAYEWMRRTQRPDGAWPARFDGHRVADATTDANFSSYIAAGVWHHYLLTADAAFLGRFWPVVETAVEFALELQSSSGEILWARDPGGRPWPGALLTSCSCIHLSLRCALAIAEAVGEERPDWELSLGALAYAVAHKPGVFEPKARYSMDWYYPVLGGVVTGEAARERLFDAWDEFVVDGFGVRCVSDRPWITTGETAELVLALDAAGLAEEAHLLLAAVHHLRTPDGSYWMGANFTDGEVYPPSERPTWGSAAVVLAEDALARRSAASGLFRAETFPSLATVAPPVADAL